MGETIDNITFIIKGLVSIYTTVGANEFKLEYLRQSDIINHTLFTYQQPAFLSMKAITHCECLKLSFSKVKTLMNQRLDSSLSKAVNDIIDHGKRVGFNKLHLDYIRTVSTPSAETPVSLENHRRMKNLGVMILSCYRAEHQRPSISQIMQDVVAREKRRRKLNKTRLVQFINRHHHIQQEEQEEEVVTTQQLLEI
jgi:CRP-like cAMP-binding protein